MRLDWRKSATRAVSPENAVLVMMVIELFINNRRCRLVAAVAKDPAAMAVMKLSCMLTTAALL
jgi:hypothetical protein